MKYYTLNHAARVMPRWLRQTLLVMKITTLILFAALMQVSAAGLAQKLTLQKNKTSLRELFAEIKKQTSYNVVWDSKIIENAKPLTVNYKNTEIETVLDEVLPSRGLEYNISDKTIVIKQKEVSLIDRIVARFQAIDVRGKVVDSLGNGLAGATVSVKNGKGSTSTDNNGNFYLKNVDEGSVLLVNYLGYVSKEHPVGREFNYIELKQSTSILDVVQVQAYGKTSRRLNVGTITTVTADEIAKQPVNNPLLALQGRVPNLVITPESGRPGTGVTMQLRGQNSLARGTDFRDRARILSQPLIIIDGIPVENNIPGFGVSISSAKNTGTVSLLSFLNPADIESIDVLSDASATSIYGSRGGNGVILITTKKGNQGTTRIDINTSLGYSDIAKRVEMLNTEQYLMLRKEAYQNDFLEVPNFNTAPGLKDATNFDLTLWDQNRYTDWQKLFLGGNANDYRANVAVSGGSSDILYRVSGSYLNQGTVLPGPYKNQSGTLQFNLNGNSSNGKLNIVLSGGYVNSQRNNPSVDLTTLALQLAPNAPPVYKKNGELNWEPNPATGFSTWLDGNPFAEFSQMTNEKTNALTANGTVNYRVFENFSLKFMGGLNRTDLGSVYIEPISSKDPAGFSFARGSAFHLTSKSNSWNFEPQALFSKLFTFGNINALFGATLSGKINDVQSISARGYVDDSSILNLALANRSSTFLQNTNSDYRYSAVFGRIDYNWKSKYLLSMSARRDGSSRFGPGNQFGNFYALGTGWILSEEKFAKVLPVVSFAKIKGSYGSSGNDAIGDYRYLELYQSPNPSISYDGVPVISSSGATNPYYHWEDIRKLELGLEVGLFKDRLFIAANYFRTRASDQLGDYTLPATAGARSIVTNRTATIQNSGMELILNTKNFQAKNFSWQSNVNFGFTRDKIIKLPTTNGGAQSFGMPLELFKVGEPFYILQTSFEFAGVNPITGLYQFYDRAKTSAYSTDRLDIVQRLNAISLSPKYQGGFGNFITFRNLSLSVFVEFKKQLARDPLSEFGALGSRVINLPVQALDRWHQPGQITNIQRLSASELSQANQIFYSAYSGSDYIRSVDASYIRLNNISLSYNLPGKYLQGIGVKGLTLSLNVQNLCTITGYEGLDAQTQSMTAMPQWRTFTGGIQLSL